MAPAPPPLPLCVASLLLLLAAAVLLLGKSAGVTWDVAPCSRAHLHTEIRNSRAGESVIPTDKQCALNREPKPSNAPASDSLLLLAPQPPIQCEQQQEIHAHSDPAQKCQRAKSVTQLQSQTRPLCRGAQHLYLPLIWHSDGLLLYFQGSQDYSLVQHQLWRLCRKLLRCQHLLLLLLRCCCRMAAVCPGLQGVWVGC